MKLINESTQNFIDINISTLAKEIVEWQDTGVLNKGSDGFLCKLALMINENTNFSIDYSQCLKIAEKIIEQECLKIVSSINK